jgi:hypothetical protein
MTTPEPQRNRILAARVTALFAENNFHVVNILFPPSILFFGHTNTEPGTGRAIGLWISRKEAALGRMNIGLRPTEPAQ